MSCTAKAEETAKSTAPSIPAPGTVTAPSSGPQPTRETASLKDRIPKLEARKRRTAPSNPAPRPETPALPPRPELSAIEFKTATRRILTPRDHELFLASPTYRLVLGWVFGLSESVAGTPVSAVQNHDLSPVVRTLLDVLDEAEKLCTESPPDDQGGSRFGNKAFRVFLNKVAGRAPAWHAALGVTDPTAAAELWCYLGQSFGNRRRIDYGSGHELNFVVWLLCLERLGILRTSASADGRGDDRKALVLRVFSRYLSLMRVVQMTYYLEPAGSHGVWGLDDYQFLPFLFGASQLLGHAYLTPRAVHQSLALEQFGPEYLYLGQVAFVDATKTVRGLRWHSPMLDDISGARDWAKVEAGMRRMFVAEVLGKLPVMQHFLFGALVPAAEGMSEPVAGRMDEDEHVDGGAVDVFDDEKGVRHVHQATGWGDCCGIKVPSSLAASEETRKRGDQLRRIPFD